MGGEEVAVGAVVVVVEGDQAETVMVVHETEMGTVMVVMTDAETGTMHFLERYFYVWFKLLWREFLSLVF